MKRPVLLDTGPLVAYLNARDKYHDWACRQFADIAPPLLTCEAVISEACFLLRHWPEATYAVMELFRRELIMVPFRLELEITPVQRLLKRYANVPISLADACLVRMAEQHAESILLTLDSDFVVYRKHGRHVIPTLAPNNL